MHINFLKYRKIYFIFSGILVIGSLACLLLFGLKFGIDFLGGSILEIDFENRPENSVIQEKLEGLNLEEIIIQPIGEQGVILRLKNIDEVSHQAILKNLEDISKLKELRFENIGPTIGKELRQKTIILVIVSLVALLIYIAISFRKVSWPVSNWMYGVVSIVTLTFDVLIPIAVFALLGKFYNIQFSISIVTALLTILGYTINDKVIIFDRIRENLLRSRESNFEGLVNKSLNETLWRSLSTGTCTLLVLFFIFFFGGETLKYFALTLIVGIVIGTASSIFLASPMLVAWLKWRKKI
ncbi:MAG: protein translocase subunit SecF [bacterium]|nr:protein translocase subunit SecF [bacterium]